MFSDEIELEESDEERVNDGLVFENWNPTVDPDEERPGHLSRLFLYGGPMEVILSFLTTFDILESVRYVSFAFHVNSIEVLIRRNPKEFRILDFFLDSVRRSFHRSVQYMLVNDMVNEGVHGQEYLQIAIRNRDFIMMNILFSRKKIRFRDEIEEDNDISILSSSIIRRDFRVFKKLVEYEHMDFDYNFCYPLRKIVDLSLSKFLRCLLKNPKVDPSVSDEYALRTSVINGCSTNVEMLLSDERVDPSHNDFIMVLNATKNKFHDILEMLLRDYRVSPNLEVFKECIETAYKNSDLKSVGILVKYCEDEEDEYINQMRNMIRHPLYRLCEYFSIAFICCFVFLLCLIILYFILGTLGVIILLTPPTAPTKTIVIYSIVFVSSLICFVCSVILGFGTIGGAARSYYQSQRWRSDHMPFSSV